MSADPLIAATPQTDQSGDELRQPLLRYLAGLGLSREESHDVAQESFLRLHRHLAQGGPAENLRSWLFRVAHNEARNRQKTYERRFGGPMDGIDVADRATPEHRLLEREKYRRLEAAFRLLPDAERDCLRLRGEGLRYREIGDVLGMPVSTVAEVVERAIRKLMEKML